MIKYLKMINWRVYTKREFNFGKGITFLMGANGTGKTSILEAISYALTGEAALFDSKTRPQLLKDPNKPATIILRIEVHEKEYEIERTQTSERAGDAQIIRLADKEVLARSHLGVTKQVEKLLDISDDFLHRIVYMAEGDVFKFLEKPPKEALEAQLRYVLGLTQLDEFSASLDEAEKYLKGRLKTLQEFNADLVRLQVRSLNELESHLSAGEAGRQQFLNQIEKISHELGQLEQHTKIAQKLQEDIQALSIAVRDSPDQWEKFARTPMIDYFEELQNKWQDTEHNHSEILILLARLDGKEEGYQRIIELLEPFDGSTDTVPCPVCRKPMTLKERQDILSEIRKDVDNLNNQREAQNARKDQLSQEIQGLQGQISQLQPLRNTITYAELPGVQLKSTYEDLVKNVAEIASGEVGARYTSLIEEREAVKKHLAELETFQAEFQAIKKRLQDFNYKSPEELDNELIRIEMRMLSIRAASQATKDTLRIQRNKDMQTIYEQIAHLWASFTGTDGWEIELDENGSPFLDNPYKGRKLDLRQLSGGEKTALLIMLHTIIAHHFSKSDFLMIDEPLEHLDSVNRRSLIRFLVDAYRHKIFNQAIIATFEESLLRKYQSSEGIDIIPVQ